MPRFRNELWVPLPELFFMNFKFWFKGRLQAASYILYEADPATNRLALTSEPKGHKSSYEGNHSLLIIHKTFKYWCKGRLQAASYILYEFAPATNRLALTSARKGHKSSYEGNHLNSLFI